MHFIIITDNVFEDGEAIRCENEDDGIQKMKDKYKEGIRNACQLDRKNTFMRADFHYAQVSDGLTISEYRLMSC